MNGDVSEYIFQIKFGIKHDDGSILKLTIPTGI